MKKIIKSFIIVLFIVFLSGCYSKEEKELAAQYKALGEENAINYIKEKYGTTPQIVKSKAQSGCSTLVSCIDSYPTGNVEVTAKMNNKRFNILISGIETNTNGVDDFQYDEIKKDIIDYFKEIISYNMQDYVIELQDNGIKEKYTKDINFALSVTKKLELYYVGNNDLSKIDLSSIYNKRNTIKIINFKTYSDYKEYKNSYSRSISSSAELKDIYKESMLTLLKDKTEYYKYDYITNYYKEVYVNPFNSKKKLKISTSYIDSVDIYRNIHEDLKTAEMIQISPAYLIPASNETMYIYFDKDEIEINKLSRLYFAYECFKGNTLTHYIDGYSGKKYSVGGSVGTLGDYYVTTANFYRSCDSDSDVSFALMYIEEK